MSSSDSWAAPADHWASLYSDLSLCVDDETQWTSLYDNSVPLENYWTPVDRIILENEEASENDGTPEHHYGPASTPFTLDNDTHEIRTVDNQLDNYINCPKTLCLHTDPNGDECFEPINCGTMPDHFRGKHNIKGLGRSHPLVCEWQGCKRTVVRHNYVRHVRECHLNHDRNSAHKHQAIVRFGG